MYVYKISVVQMNGWNWAFTVDWEESNEATGNQVLHPQSPTNSKASCKEKADLLNFAEEHWLLKVGINPREDWAKYREEICWGW